LGKDFSEFRDLTKEEFQKILDEENFEANTLKREKLFRNLKKQEGFFQAPFAPISCNICNFFLAFFLTNLFHSEHEPNKTDGSQV
jgi:hypothetical protein